METAEEIKNSILNSSKYDFHEAVNHLHKELHSINFEGEQNNSFAYLWIIYYP